MSKNRFYRGAKINEDEFLAILQAFCKNVSATDASRLVGLSVRSTNDIYIKIRERIYDKVISDPNSFNEARNSLVEAIIYRGYNSFFDDNGQHPILMELFRCCSGEIMDRISTSGLRLDSIMVHSIELYTRKKENYWSPFNFSIKSGRKYDVHIIKAMEDINRNDMKSFKENINSVPPLELDNYGSRTATGIYDELFSDISRNPI